ncbi:sugar transport protein [Cricetibacter osteomyelitidis]|uniref:Sugar transport protein n=1 Tax=Cricetibacter osteomyelitidis TaxID=1521931 RepID=A0A4R2SZ01_9PAST|nr:MFS transporter [Cricetibacter osteomyelitidis]TCP94745.1 sugar transport protein [Cricetibacter osteomyelitidis]
MINENQYLVEKFNGVFPMWLFAGVATLGFWFLVRCLPETKGVSLEKMEQLMLDKRDGKI